jgi:preprotein translocase subunit SecF
MIQVFTHANFPLMGRAKLFFMGFSAIAILLSVWAIATRGFNYGIDFAGGTAVRLKFLESPRVEEMRAALDRAGFEGLTIQRIGEESDHEVLIRVEQQHAATATPGDEGGKISDRILQALQTPEQKSAAQAGRLDLNIASEVEIRDWLSGRLPAQAGGAAGPGAAAVAAALVAYRTAHAGLFTDAKAIGAIPGLGPDAAKLLSAEATLGPLSLRGVDFVGPTAGKELMQNTALAVLGSVAGILIYVWVRFHWMWGLTSVIAVVHDVLIAAGAVALTRKEFSLDVVAALLTILGYSINDTIVVFDRIRENLRVYREVEFETVVNASINQTLSRTILTSFTVFIAITALFLYGGDKLEPLSFCLMVGVVFGTYSSIFVASALLVIAYQRLGAKFVKS